MAAHDVEEVLQVVVTARGVNQCFKMWTGADDCLMHKKEHSQGPTPQVSRLVEQLHTL